MAYLTQDATVGKETWRFYGEQPAHDHDASTKFSTAVTGVMKATYGDKAAIELGHFASNQSSIPSSGKGFKGVVELVYKNKAWAQKATKAATKSSKKAAKKARA